MKQLANKHRYQILFPRNERELWYIITTMNSWRTVVNGTEARVGGEALNLTIEITEGAIRSEAAKQI